MSLDSVTRTITSATVKKALPTQQNSAQKLAVHTMNTANLKPKQVIQQ